MTNSKSESMIILISNDLLFATKLKHAATSRGLVLKSVASESAMRSILEISDAHFPVAIIDLAVMGHVLEQIADLAKTYQIPLLGYAPHVQADLIERARLVGCDRVITRGQMSRDASTILSDYVSPQQ
jgi:ActR/RegA family two-component response regulator